MQRKVIGLLQKRGALRSGQLERALPRQNWRGATDSLLRMGILTSRVELPGPGVRPKTIRTAQLGCSPEQVSEAMLEIGKPGSAASLRRQAILRYLLAETGPTDVAWVYAQSGGNSNDLRYLEQRGLVVLGESEVWRDPLEQIDYHPSYPLSLTRDQQAVWLQVQEQMQRVRAGESARPMLLFGVTGSGKTELYLRAVAEALDNGQQAIVLVPEIALTPQTVRRFLARFPGRVGLLHSGLSDGERYDTWRRARAGSLSVVVGPRSALFTPFGQLGLIVVDECHDDSYYQPDPPFYHAREVAPVYARLANAVCLLGSATPDITSTYQVQKGNWLGLSLPERILAHRDVVQAQLARLAQEHGEAQGEVSSYRPYEQEAETTDLPLVQVVDLREELKAGNRSIFSRLLQASLEQVLTRGEQAILFLNRLGAATYVFCRDCGFVLKCPRCDMPLTYHENAPLRTPQDKPILLCHHCGYRRQMPAQCPKCGSSRVRQYGSGTERVQSEVQALFPKARTLRWDFTTTRKKGAHDVILSHFVAHRADILIGTQMLAKGLDLPFVTLVGAILADVGLSLPDYRAGERTFQVLTQVAGRAGRSPLGGQVILQTFQPESYVIQAAAKHAYGQFYEQELDYRRKLGYPPFTNMVRLEFRHHDSEQRRANGAAAWGRAEKTNSSRRPAGYPDYRTRPCLFCPGGWAIPLAADY